MLNSPHDERKLSSRNLNFDHRRLCLNSLKKLTFKQAWLRCVALLHRNFFGDRGGGWECKPRRFSFSTNRIRQLVPSFICWPQVRMGEYWTGSLWRYSWELKNFILLRNLNHASLWIWQILRTVKEMDKYLQQGQGRGHGRGFPMYTIP